MKTKEQIEAAIKQCEAAIKQCDLAQQQGEVSFCPIWPEDYSLHCIDCTCRYALRWVLEIKEK